MLLSNMMPEAEARKRAEIAVDVLARNDAVAARLRQDARCGGYAAVNLISSPGAGKTTLLERTIAQLNGSVGVCVIEGDQQTENDARRIKAAGARAVQINTRDGCHLEANQVQRARDALAPQPGELLFIENVGNLVCPACYDLGETARVVLASVTEGEDKPLKYPRAFETADVCVITKVDLLPYLPFDFEQLVRNVRAVNPRLRVMEASMNADNREWIEWLEGLVDC